MLELISAFRLIRRTSIDHLSSLREEVVLLLREERHLEVPRLAVLYLEVLHLEVLHLGVLHLEGQHPAAPLQAALHPVALRPMALHLVELRLAVPLRVGTPLVPLAVVLLVGLLRVALHLEVPLRAALLPVGPTSVERSIIPPNKAQSVSTSSTIGDMMVLPSSYSNVTVPRRRNGSSGRGRPKSD